MRPDSASGDTQGKQRSLFAAVPVCLLLCLAQTLTAAIAVRLRQLLADLIGLVMYCLPTELLCDAAAGGCSYHSPCLHLPLPVLLLPLRVTRHLLLGRVSACATA